MRLIKQTPILRLFCCLLAIFLSFGSVASASMSASMYLGKDDKNAEQNIGIQNLTLQSHHSSDMVESEGMMHSGNHSESQHVTCDLICTVSVSILPHTVSIPEIYYQKRFWTIPEHSRYISDLYSLLFKPPKL